jgi:hypothetical protein
MAKGSKGERRPADANMGAVMVARIATGEIEDKETDDGKNAAAVALGTAVLTNYLNSHHATSQNIQQFRIKNCLGSAALGSGTLRSVANRRSTRVSRMSSSTASIFISDVKQGETK